MVSEDEELCAVEETPRITDADADDGDDDADGDDDDVNADDYQRLYGRQQISFTVRSHIAVIAPSVAAAESASVCR